MGWPIGASEVREDGTEGCLGWKGKAETMMGCVSEFSVALYFPLPPHHLAGQVLGIVQRPQDLVPVLFLRCLPGLDTLEVSL